MQHSVVTRTHLDEAEVQVDLHDGRADVVLTGTVGPRTTSVLRTVFEALDGLPGPVALDRASATDLAHDVDDVVDAARARRRVRGLADLTVTS